VKEILEDLGNVKAEEAKNELYTEICLSPLTERQLKKGRRRRTNPD
jgi:hypothetical protein